MLLPVEPVTFILTAIWPEVFAVALFLVRNVRAYETSTVLPIKSALALHLVILPHSRETAAVSPGVDTLTVDVVAQILALIAGSV